MEISKMTDKFTLKSWHLMFIMGLTITIFEVFEHLNHDHLLIRDPDFLLEVLALGVILPIIGGILLNKLGHTRSERDLATNQLDNLAQIRQSLNNDDRWEDLLTSIVKIPK